MAAIKAAIGSKSVSFLVATGTHRHPTVAELYDIFGQDFYEKYKTRIHIHGCHAAHDLAAFGYAGNGTEVILHRRCVAAKKIVVIGIVELHYFAGYTGERKAFLLGGIIEGNHQHALRPEAKLPALAGNRVDEDMADALELLRGETHLFHSDCTGQRTQDICHGSGRYRGFICCCY